MSVPKTAIIGASGFIGRHLLRACRQAHPDCVGTTLSRSAPGLIPFDLIAPDISKLHLEETAHQAVVIAAAQPNVSACERNPRETGAVNVDGTLSLIQQLGRASLKVVFLSSDHVFDGASGGYDDTAALNPRTEYGRQKMMVEREIPNLVKDYLILRLSKIYGVCKGDRTLLDEMASVLSAGGEVVAARDQRFQPTLVNDIVRAVLAIQGRECRGVMNVCNPQVWSRIQIAEMLASAMGKAPSLIREVSLHDIPSMAKWPLDTTMFCSRLNREVGISFTPLQDAIACVAANWAA